MRFVISFNPELDWVTDKELKSDIHYKAPEQLTTEWFLRILLHRLREGNSGLDALGFCGAKKEDN